MPKSDLMYAQEVYAKCLPLIKEIDDWDGWDTIYDVVRDGSGTDVSQALWDFVHATDNFYKQMPSGQSLSWFSGLVDRDVSDDLHASFQMAQDARAALNDMVRNMGKVTSSKRSEIWSYLDTFLQGMKNFKDGLEAIDDDINGD